MSHNVILLICLFFCLNTFANSQEKASINNRADLIIKSSIPDTELWSALYAEEGNPGISNVKVTNKSHWAPDQLGSFQNLPPIGDIYLKDGIVLSTGKAEECVGPNSKTSTSGEGGFPGVTILTDLFGYATYDAVDFQVEFTCDETVEGFSFVFCFGSEEWPEFMGSKFSDGFACFLDGENIAYNEENPIFSVNSITMDNDNNQVNLEFDGFTKVFRLSQRLTPGTHVIRFMIADAADYRLDSGVFLSDFRFVYSGKDEVIPIGKTISVPKMLSAGATQRLAWSVAETEYPLILEHSSDNQKSWSVVADGLVDSLYDWSIPDIESHQNYLRLLNKQSGTTVGVSREFAIVKVTNTLDSLKDCFIGDTISISWELVDGSEEYTLELSVDGGVSWNTLHAVATPPYIWSVAHMVTEQAIVRVRSHTSPTIEKSSPLFSIENPLEVLSPNGGEELGGGSWESALWFTKRDIPKIRFECTRDSARTWEPIGVNLDNINEHHWITNKEGGDYCKIRVVSAVNPLVFDESDDFFRILPGIGIVVTDSSASPEELLVYPNPASISADEVKIAVPSNLSGIGELIICDNLGATLDLQPFEFTNGATLSWDLRNSDGKKVSSGSYVALLQVTNRSGEVSRYKVLFGVEE